MALFSKLDYRRGSKSLIVKPVQTTQGMRLRDCAPSFPVLCRLLSLFLALAVSTPVLLAQEWDHVNGRDKVHDPTGAWLLKGDAEGSPFILSVFHRGGTFTGDLQGESAFDPAATNPPKPPSNVINSPESGVWQKTGWNTFAVTFLTMEYQVDASTNPPSAPLFQFDKVQFTGRLNETGDLMEITAAVITNFDPKGELIGEPNQFSTKVHGVRIPLEVLPNTSRSLPIPKPAPAP
jgi:hypothetical protein